MTEVGCPRRGVIDSNLYLLCQVHHIDPKGQDSGVVYSEMQGRENTSGDLMALRFLLSPFARRSSLTLYPKLTEVT